MNMKKLIALLMTLLVLLGVAACSDEAASVGIIGGADGPTSIYIKGPDSEEESKELLDEDGWYYSAADVSLYLYLYNHLPENFITKDEAEELGWEGGSLEPVAPGMCIGGDYFGNYEGLLPEDREYTECDIDTLGKNSRGAKRIVFSEDGLIYYTDDHYESFTLLYGEE